MLCPTPSLLNIKPSNLFHLDLCTPTSQSSWKIPALSHPIPVQHKALQPFPCRPFPSVSQCPQAPGTPLFCPTPSLLNIKPPNIFHPDLCPPASRSSWNTLVQSYTISAQHKTLQPFPCRPVPWCLPVSLGAPQLCPSPPCPCRAVGECVAALVWCFLPGTGVV